MPDWNGPDLLARLSSKVDFKEVQRLRLNRDQQPISEKFAEIDRQLERLSATIDLPAQIVTKLAQAQIVIGEQQDLTGQQHEGVTRAIELLKPWRKGPFQLFGQEIDAEWQSNLKWDRIAEALGDLRSRQVLDVGCGNGYYMFRAAAGQPEMVIGFDPSVQFCLAYRLFQQFAGLKNLQYERLAAEHLYVFDRAFDVAICMGVLYHRKNPLEILQSLKNSLKVGGFAIIESQTIPGNGPHALFPAQRYAKARNVFFVPTCDCLVNWVARAGFKDVEVISHEKVTTNEQRATSLMDFESLADFLDPADPNLTIEGYPAPYRTAVRAVRKFL